MQVISKDVVTGEVTERDYTEDELAAVVDMEVEREANSVFPDQVQAEVNALGTRAELLDELEALVGISPQVKGYLTKLTNVVYSSAKQTVD